MHPHWRHHEHFGHHGPPWRWRHHGDRRWFFRRYVRARLHRRLFWWFGAAILMTALSVAGIGAWISHSSSAGTSSWSRDMDRLREFTGHQFAQVWDNPAQRDALVRSVSHDLDLDVRVMDARGIALISEGRTCSHGFRVPIERAGFQVGTVVLCGIERHRAGPSWKFFIPLGVAFIMLWGASGRISRRLTRPLWELANVAQELGTGKLSARADLNCTESDEVRMLAEAINDMASRIEKQMTDQRQLLATVSHELRTPLGHLRLLVELARENATRDHALAEIDQEVIEIDALVGQLLMASRLDFVTLSVTKLDAAELARRALERAGVEPNRLRLEAETTEFAGDPTLIQRAVANLLDNARKHGNGVAALRVKSRPGFISFEVEDNGTGFPPGEETRAFEAFYTKATGSERDRDTSLGLGLNLVKRTAEAHGGTAYAMNRPEGGARVGFEIPQTAVVQQTQGTSPNVQ